jgi:hypothetical protein
LALPVVAPNIGAFPERLLNREWTWVQQWQTSCRDWSQFFLDVAERHFKTGVRPPVLPGQPVAHSFNYARDYSTLPSDDAACKCEPALLSGVWRPRLSGMGLR